jgi:hypothetical protein
MTDHLSPLVSNPLSGRNGALSVMQRPTHVAAEHAGERHHWLIRYVNAPESMPSADPDTIAEALVRADHTAAKVFGVAKTAERRCFEFRRTSLTCQHKARPMLAKAAFDIAPREEQIATQEVNPRRFYLQPQSRCDLLSLLEVGEGPFEIIRDALDRGKSQPRPATVLLALRRREGRLVGGLGRARPTEVVEEITALAGEREAEAGIACELKPALNLCQGRLVTVPLSQRRSGIEIRTRCIRILCPI